MSKSCKQCGEDVATSIHGAWQLKRSKFCNMVCYQAYHRRKKIVHCGKCGKTFSVGMSNRKQFCSARCRYKAARKDGTRYISGNGYVYIHKRDHPDGRYTRGWILEHRLIAEQTLGRRLRPGECVHHVNGIRADNRPENIIVCDNHGEHVKHHLRGYHGWIIGVIAPPNRAHAG